MLSRDYYVAIPIAISGITAALALLFGQFLLRDNTLGCNILATWASAVGFLGITGYIAGAIGPAKSFLAMLGQTGLLIFTYSSIYRHHGYSDQQAVVVPKDANEVVVPPYVEDPVYVSVVTWTGLGDPGALPMVAMRYATALESITGYIFLALLLGIVGSAVTGNSGVGGAGGTQPSSPWTGR